MKIKKILGLLSFMLLSSIGIAQTEKLSLNPLSIVLIDTMYDTYFKLEQSDHYVIGYLNKKRDINWLKEQNAVSRVKYLTTGKIKSKDLDIFKNTMEYWELKANIRMDKNTVLPAVKGIRSYLIGNGLKLFDFAKYTPNLELLSAYTSSMIQVLPPKLRALQLEFYNNKWDGMLPEAFFYSLTLEAIGVARYTDYKKSEKLNPRVGFKLLPVYLPEIKQDNYTLKKFLCNIDISVPGNIDKLTKLKGLKVLGISFKEVPSEEELKKLSYIDYIVIRDAPSNLTREEMIAYEENVKLLIQRLGKKIVPNRWAFRILH